MVDEDPMELGLKGLTRAAPLLAFMLAGACDPGPQGDPDAVPSVSAGPDRTVEVGSTVELNGTTNGNTATHKWEFVSQPSGTPSIIENAYQLSGATFIADRAGDYVVKLIGATSSNPTAPDVNPAATDEATITAVSGDAGTGGTGGSGGSSCAEPPPGSVIIEDQGFDDPDWELAVSQTEGATVSTDPTGQQISGGVGGSAYRSMVHEITNPNVGEDPGCTVDGCSYTLQVTHRYQSGSYTPATEGAIDYIDYSESRIITEPAFEGAAVGWRFAIWQDGVRYILDSALHPNSAFADVVWTTESNCELRPEDFTPAGLNFQNGSELSFGYIRSNTNTSAGSLQRNVHGIDDFRLVIVKAN